jgi:Heterokaryon incompatibility protein (HET)
MHQYIYKALSRSSNIRLVTIFPGRSSDDISIDLQEYVFDNSSPPKYEALSYVWGSQSDLKSIQVGPLQTMSITRNLVSMLQHLRSESEPRTVWIDALAIDQSNSTEKSTQVAMMADIYRLAVRVVAWLGPERVYGPRALDIMFDIGSQVQMEWKTKTLNPAPDCSDPSVADPKIELALDHDEIVAVHELISLPWFERLWIRQEVFLGSPNTVIQRGNQEVLWKTFRGALVSLYLKSGPLSLYCPELLQRLEYLRGFIFQNTRVALWDLREEFGNAKCQDPRDRIYAVSSMLYPHEQALCPQPNYKMPVVEVYREVILRHLSEFRSLELLRECELPENASWPSWVPDWSRQAATASFRTLPLLATSKLAAWYETSELDGLKVAGVSATTVTEVVEIPHDKFHTLEQMYNWAHGLLAHQNLEDLYISGCRMTEAYARTLVCDGIHDEMDPAGGVWPKLETAKLATEHIQAEAHYSSQKFSQNSPSELFLRCLRPIRGKKFVKCDKGYIGITPNITQPGDVVCVLLGCRAPMILRPNGTGGHLVVGESFIHGLSKGEAILGPLPKHIRIAKVIQNESVGYAFGFVNGLTNTTSFLDPRFKVFLMDIEAYVNQLNVNGNASFSVHPEHLRKCGINIEYFNLT